MVKEVKKKNTVKSSARTSATKKAVKKVTGGRKMQAVKRVVQKVPRKKVSILVLVVLAMASVVTVAWLFDFV